MKRRDLLKGAGTLMLGAPALHASALLNPNPAPQGGSKDLIVTFNGPFVFWQRPEELPDHIKVIFPPLGPHDKPAHQPWFGTSLNEKAVKKEDLMKGKDFILLLDGYKPTDPEITGTPAFPYDQDDPTGGVSPLMNVYVPLPKTIIGVRRTVAKMVCTGSEQKDYCKKYDIYASGWTFVYPNVDLDNIVMNYFFATKPLEEKIFTPCFTNDASLQQATLSINLTALDRRDTGHQHATEAWKAMLSMFPLMQKEITSILFCEEFDPADCNFQPSKCKDKPKVHPNVPQVGPGSDCEAPLCNMGPGTKPKRYKAP